MAHKKHAASSFSRLISPYIHILLLCFLLLFSAACDNNDTASTQKKGTPTPLASATKPTRPTPTPTATPEIEPTPTPDTRPRGPLPGQILWKDGVSSFLFGTNDTQEWSDHNIQTESDIQLALRDAGVALIRTFFIDNADDDAIERRMQTVENIGAQCLGVLTNVRNETYNAHVVQYLGNRCQMYEFGNEDDFNGMSVTEYLSLWNRQIPKLRKLNPKAVFIGPDTYNKTGLNDFLQNFLNGVASSHVLPDAVSFHWYPCWKMDRATCLAQASSAVDWVAEVRAKIKNTLGKDLPIGITEWNYDPANPPPSYGDDPDFIKQYTTEAFNSMIRAKIDFACQFDAASYSGQGRLDMFDLKNNNQPKPQFDAMKAVIAQYRTAG